MYTPPSYAARSDWMHVLDFGGPMGTWQFQFTIYWKTYRNSGHGDTIDEAWRKLRLSKRHAGQALQSAMPRPNNNVGAVPPEVASRVFARSVATKPVADYPDLVLRDEIVPTMDDSVNFSSFIAPVYTPRADWRERLEASFKRRDKSWQADLAEYWRLRTRQHLSEAQAWAKIAMTPENARQALVREAPTPDNDSGLIPSDPDGPTKEAVARRLFARALATDINAKDIYPGLQLAAPNLLWSKSNGTLPSGFRQQA